MTGNEAIRWVFDSGDGFAHVVADSTTSEVGVLMTTCARE